MSRWSIQNFRAARRSPALPATAALACAVAAAVLAGCDGEGSAARSSTTRPAEPLSVAVGPISRGSIDRTVEIVGTLFGEEEAFISSKSSGRVVSINADLGDRVDSGATLAQIDPTDYRFTLEQRRLLLRETLAKLGFSVLPAEDFDPTTVATVQRAAVQTQNAKARLDRAKQLYEQSPPLMSEQDYADIETQYRVFQRDYDVAVLDAQATLASARSLDAAARIAQQQLDDTTVRAPAEPGMSWAIADRRVSAGELMQPGTSMFRVIADKTVRLRAAVPERYVTQVAVGQVVALHLESLSAPVSGTISRVSPSVDVASRTFTVEARFDNAAQTLRPGAFARGTITVGQRDDVSSVPAAALFSFAGLDKVFTVRDGVAVQHTVTVVEQTPERVIVEGDLGGATQAIVSGLARLADKSPVSIQQK